MFIIPCKFTSDNPIIFECIERIKTFHPKERVIVVDSASDDKSYYSKLKGVTICDIDNRNYGTNAYSFIWKEFPKEEFFFCFQDSILLNANVDSLKEKELTTLRHFNSPPTGIGFDENGIELSVWASQQMDIHMNYSIPSQYIGVFGPVWFCNRNVMERLESTGVFNILPQNKYQLCAMERIIGIAMQKCGLDPSNSIQGEMLDFYGAYDNSLMEKVHLTRW